MNIEHLEIYNAQYENCGECEYAEKLGCRSCKPCAVEEYEKEVKEIYEKAEKEEQKLLEKLYGTEDKSNIYYKDNKCVYNESSDAHKRILKFDEEHKNDKYYSGLADLSISVCYECNRCGMWGKK